MSRHCVLLLTLAVFIFLTGDAYPRANFVEEIPKENVESGDTSNDAGNVGSASESFRIATQPPRRRPTKKPGTYLQSIWDISGNK